MASLISHVTFFAITLMSVRSVYRCPPKFIVAWKELPPYTEIINNTAAGILLDIFKEGMRTCCNDGIYNATHFEFTSQYDLNHLLENEAPVRLVQFMLPVQRDSKTQHYLEHPFVPILVSQGFALFLKPPGNSITILLNAIRPVLPVLLISMLAVGIVGVLFWMIENMIETLAWNGETPERFNPGVWNGMWWALIAMTTIGYGDIIPKTKPGKIFSVFWILAGIVICGILVSSIASVLIESLWLSQKTLALMNENIGVMHGSEEYRYALKKQGIPHQFHTIHEISNALQRGNVSMAIVDVLVALRYKEEFNDFVLDRMIEPKIINGVGVVFLPRARQYSHCIRHFVLESQREIANKVSKLLEGTNFRSHGRVEASSIIDPSSPAVRDGLLALFVLLVLLTSCGLVKEYFPSCGLMKEYFSGCKSHKKKKEDEERQAKLSKDLEEDEEKQAWLLNNSNEEYHRELMDLINLLKKKCENHMADS